MAGAAGAGYRTVGGLVTAIATSIVSSKLKNGYESKGTEAIGMSMDQSFQG